MLFATCLLIATITYYIVSISYLHKIFIYRRTSKGRG